MPLTAEAGTKSDLSNKSDYLDFTFVSRYFYFTSILSDSTTYYHYHYAL